MLLLTSFLIVFSSKHREKKFVGKPVPTDNRHGLIFRAFLYLFQLLQERKEDTNFVLKASFLEIYNEKVSEFQRVNFLIFEILLQRL